VKKQTTTPLLLLNVGHLSVPTGTDGQQRLQPFCVGIGAPSVALLDQGRSSAMNTRNRKYNSNVHTVDARMLKSVGSNTGRVVVTTRDDTGSIVTRSVQSISDVAANGVAIPNPFSEIDEHRD